MAASTALAGPLTLHRRAEPLPSTQQGPFVTLADGSVLCIGAKEAFVSVDEGRTWVGTPLFKNPKKYTVSNERALLRTRDGVIIAAWMNMAEKQHAPGFHWGGDEAEFHQWILPTMICRSLDEGKTWEDPICINRPWCGCIHSLIETRQGRIVLPAQEVIPAWRHATYVFSSGDKGVTWRKSNILDIGQGRHDHAGSIEGTVVELADGSLYQLLRTETGYLYEARSRDGGLTWIDFGRSEIRSVTCCAQLYRLADGSIALLWNRPPRHRPAERHSRVELSIAFSTDDCVTWSPPVVIAANYAQPGSPPGGGRVSYPYLYERRPGEFWITTMQGGLRMKIRRRDIVVEQTPTLEAIVIIGDSAAAPRSREVGAVYGDHLAAAMRQAGGKMVAINSAISADTTESARARFPIHVLDLKPKLVILHFGMNDAAIDVWKKPPTTRPRVSRERYEENLRWMIEQTRAHKAKPILLTAAPIRWTDTLRRLYGKAPYDVGVETGFEQAAIIPFNNAVRHLAADMNVPLVDVFKLFEKQAEDSGKPISELLVPSGISAVNDAGHTLIAKALLPLIRRELALPE